VCPMNEGLVSAVIPTFNRLHYLREAIDSVCVQTRPVSEIIVVDDGSNDGTEEFLADFVGAVPLRVIRQENAGQAAARNRGILAAQGEWVAFLDSDDLWCPTKLEEQMNFLNENPEIDFLFGHMVNFTQDGDASGPEILNQSVYEYCRDNASDLKEFFEMLLLSNPVPTSSVIFRRSMCEKVGPMRENLRCSEDYDWWLKWSLLAKCGFLDRIVERRRLHTSNAILDRQLMLTSDLRVLEDLKLKAEHLKNGAIAEIDAAIHRKRYEIACDHFVARKADTYAYLSSINPLHLSGVILKLKWFAKLFIAKTLFR